MLMMAIMVAVLGVNAQKITLGTYTTKDHGHYQGELMGGKPHGKGTTTYDNVDDYKGE